MIKGTLFKSLYDVATDEAIDFNYFVDFEKVLYKLADIPRKDKTSAYLMSPASYISGTTRKNDNVTSWGGWCAVDVDDYEGDIDNYSVGKYHYVCYSTASSTKENPKFRLVFPLTRQIQREEIKHFWFALNTELGEVGDIQTKDLSRMYYIPGKYANAFNFIFTREGDYIDPKILMDKHEYIEKGGDTFFDKLPKSMQEALINHTKNSLTNTDVTWTSYRDCPFFPKNLETEYKSITGTGWYYKMYQIMVALAGNAIKSKYPITAKEIAWLCRELDMDTGNWYEKRPLDKEAERALEYVMKNQL
tara:strand:- start:785 stop:1696 length:912 start_codon:yes stop_codon:yes gene_type:complete